MQAHALRERLWRVKDSYQRAGDWRSWQQMVRGLPRGLATLKIRINGSTVDVTVRGGTEDETMLGLIVTNESEYRLPLSPRAFSPHTIFDLGANIGLTTIYFAVTYPQANIYAFEPLPDNVELLRRNVAQFGPRVRVFPFGLGERPGTFPYEMSPEPSNFGGGSFVTDGVPSGREILQLPVRTLKDVCESERLPQPDAIKIDVEGFEAPILRGAPPDLFAKSHVIIGELHGEDDYAILSQLNHTHKVGHRKQWNRPFAFFEAVRRQES